MSFCLVVLSLAGGCPLLWCCAKGGAEQNRCATFYYMEEASHTTSPRRRAKSTIFWWFVLLSCLLFRIPRVGCAGRSWQGKKATTKSGESQHGSPLEPALNVASEVLIFAGSQYMRRGRRGRRDPLLLLLRAYTACRRNFSYLSWQYVGVTTHNMAMLVQAYHTRERSCSHAGG